MRKVIQKISVRLVLFLAVKTRLFEGEREVLTLKKGDDLLKYVIGGYGLFGVIFEARLSVSNNVKVWMETLHIKPVDFPHIYAGVLKTGCVMKLARIDIVSFEWIALYVFRSDSKCNTVSDLPIKAREMGPISRLMYKWLSGPLMEVRFAAERKFGIALDWAPGLSLCLLLNFYFFSSEYQ